MIDCQKTSKQFKELTSFVHNDIFERKRNEKNTSNYRLFNHPPPPPPA